MERTLSLKEIHLADKRTKWVALSVIAHLILILIPAVKESSILSTASFTPMSQKVQVQFRKLEKPKPTPLVKKKEVKKLDKVARKKVEKKVEKVEELKEVQKTINRIYTDNKSINKLLKRSVTPIYPRILQRRQVKGHAIISFFVSKNGEIQDIQIVETTHKLFAKSAIDAINQFDFNSLPNGMKIVHKYVYNLE